MPLHSASDLDQRRLNTLNSKDGSTFPQNVFLPYPQNHPKTIFWGTFQCKTYYTDGRLGGSVKTTSAYQARSSASVPRGIVPTSPRCRMASRQHLRSASQQSWSYRVTSSAPMADGLSVWLVRRSGIPCRTACGIRLLAGTVSDNLWRRFC